MARAEIEDRPLMRAFAASVAQRAGAAQDRRDIGRGRDWLRNLRADEMTLRFFFSRSSASVTNSIMRS